MLYKIWVHVCSAYYIYNKKVLTIGYNITQWKISLLYFVNVLSFYPYYLEVKLPSHNLMMAVAFVASHNTNTM